MPFKPSTITSKASHASEDFFISHGMPPSRRGQGGCRLRMNERRRPTYLPGALTRL
jgi:hypothetical protein